MGSCYSSGSTYRSSSTRTVDGAGHLVGEGVVASSRYDELKLEPLASTHSDPDPDRDNPNSIVLGSPLSMSTTSWWPEPDEQETVGLRTEHGTVEPSTAPDLESEHYPTPKLNLDHLLNDQPATQDRSKTFHFPTAESANNSSELALPHDPLPCVPLPLHSSVTRDPLRTATSELSSPKKDYETDVAPSCPIQERPCTKAPVHKSRGVSAPSVSVQHRLVAYPRHVVDWLDDQIRIRVKRINFASSAIDLGHTAPTVAHRLPKPPNPQPVSWRETDAIKVTSIHCR
jgi:hypothetical protein